MKRKLIQVDHVVFRVDHVTLISTKNEKRWNNQTEETVYIIQVWTIGKETPFEFIYTDKKIFKDSYNNLLKEMLYVCDQRYITVKADNGQE